MKRPSWASILRRLWPWVRPHSLLFGAGFALVLASTLAELAFPVLIGKAVDATLSPGGKTLLLQYCLLFAGLSVAKAILDAIQAFTIQVTGQRIVFDLRAAVFDHLCRLPISYFDKNPTGRLLTRVVNDIKSLSDLFTASMSVLILDALVIVGTLFAMVSLHWKLALIVLTTFPFVVFLITTFGNRLAHAYRKVRARLSEINSFLGETVGALATVQRLTAQAERQGKFEGIVAQHRAAQMESLQVFAVVQPWTNVFNGVAIAILLGVGGMWVLEGKISLGVLVMFLGYLRNLFQPVRDLVEKYNTFLSSAVSAERIDEILSVQPEQTGGGVVPHLENYQIEFEGVSFQYPTRESVALKQVSFKIPHGSTVAVVGRTGSGKSTLVRLMLRFYEPHVGRIRIGGIPIASLPKEVLRKQMGVVQQEVFLFQGTLRENLLLGRQGVSDVVLEQACRRVQLWDLIADRGGLELQILEGGTNLSLGERQLLSFARVLVQDNPILIFDEATSSVDRTLERRLLGAIQEVLRNRTCIVIAHRLATLQDANLLIVLEEGRVTFTGPPRDFSFQNPATP